MVEDVTHADKNFECGDGWDGLPKLERSVSYWVAPELRPAVSTSLRNELFVLLQVIVRLSSPKPNNAIPV